MGPWLSFKPSVLFHYDGWLCTRPQSPSEYDNLECVHDSQNISNSTEEHPFISLQDYFSFITVTEQPGTLADVSLEARGHIQGWLLGIRALNRNSLLQEICHSV